MLELGAPFNWCDRNCERCPLARTCPVYEASENAKEQPLGDALLEALQRTESRMRAEFEARPSRTAGPDEETWVEPEPGRTSFDLPLVDGELVEIARRYAFAIIERVPAREDLAMLATLLYGKVTRVASELEDGGDRVWEMDVVPNLLLIERTLDTLAGTPELAELAPDAETLEDMLAPAIAAIPHHVREAVRILAAAGRAPSPFAQW